MSRLIIRIPKTGLLWNVCLVCLPLGLMAAAPGEIKPVPLAADVPLPPAARKVPWATTIHGETLVDDYHWLRNRQDPEVTRYVASENAYTAAMMKPTERLQELLYQEMLGHYSQNDMSVPYRLAGHLYYIKTERGKQYPIWCRRPVTNPTGPEQVVLDLNELAAGHTFFRIHQFAYSDDGNYLAYTTDVTGFRDFTLHIKDLRTSKHLADRMESVRTLAWAADNATLFYIVEDAAKRPYRLYRHVIGTGTGPDALVCEESDELYRLSVSRSRDREYNFVVSESMTTSETRAIPSHSPTDALRMIVPRQEGHRYDVEHHRSDFLVRTNLGAEDFRVVAAAVTDPRPEHWRDLLPHRSGRLIESLAVFAHHAVIMAREGGLPQVVVVDLEKGGDHLVQFTEPAYSVWPDVNPDYNTDTFRFHYMSFVTPERVYDYRMPARELALLKQTEGSGDYDPAEYVMEWTHAVAADGAHVPISLVARKDVPRDGSAPLLLFGYGAYGAPMDVKFDPIRLSLLDRGVIYAQAHVRGGDDLGKRWQEQGKLLNKRNTFTDFVAVAETLIARKYTSADRLAIQSLSAGGALVGAVMNMRPDLFRAAVLQGPFLDVVNTTLDPSLPLTIPEYLEWGDPRKKAEFDYIKGYCPYTNITAQSYPAMLLLTSFDDGQVMYWEPVKYAARLRATAIGNHPLLLRVASGIGHTGPSGLHDRLREKAFVDAFLLSQIAMDNQ